MTMRAINLAAILAVLALLATQSLFLVRANEQAVLLRFGQLVDDHVGPGLHLKLPAADEVHRLDLRLQVSDSGRAEYFTAGGDTLLADAYAVWQVQDNARYWLATGGDPGRVEMLLMPLVKEGLRQHFAAVGRQQGLAGLPAAALADVVRDADAGALREFGIHVVDVRLRATALPPAVQEAAFKRMRADRARIAADYRAQGTALMAEVRSKAEAEQAAVLADAYLQAERRRGQGDAEAAAIAARAYGSDPEFYRFYRALQAYRNGFSKPGDVMVLRSDSEFLRFMKKPEN